MIPVVGGRMRLTSLRSNAAVAKAATQSAPSQIKPFDKTSDHLKSWEPDSWKKYEALQQPEYPDKDALNASVQRIAESPPLVFAGECRNMQKSLAKAALGQGFILQGGDCAEAFSQFNANFIRDTYRVLLQMSVILMFGSGMPVTKMGRLAGQFAKPRTAPMEQIGDKELPSYRGDIINGPEFTEEARVPHPDRLIRAYHQSAATLNLLRGFSTGGYAAMNRVQDWNLQFMENTDKGADYMELASRVDEAMQFMSACGVGEELLQSTEFYTGHECLLLDYEQALTREDSTTGLYYDCSAHFVWCGERTRQLDGAHVEFLRGIANPIGVKVSDKMDPADLVTIIETLNPKNTPGRLSIIVRMGATKIREKLPALLRAVQNAGLVVAWITDAVHGNTETVNGVKTRRYENVKAEVEAFFDVHDEVGTWPGGLHVEMTGQNVTECIGGGSQVTADMLNDRYHTHCDPRLNAEQALEIAFYAASRLRERRQKDAAKQAEQAK